MEIFNVSTLRKEPGVTVNYDRVSSSVNIDEHCHIRGCNQKHPPENFNNYPFNYRYQQFLFVYQIPQVS